MSFIHYNAKSSQGRNSSSSWNFVRDHSSASGNRGGLGPPLFGGKSVKRLTPSNTYTGLTLAPSPLSPLSLAPEVVVRDGGGAITYVKSCFVPTHSRKRAQALSL